MGEFCNPEIESRIIYENYAVRGEVKYVFLAVSQVGQQFAGFGEHVGYSHYCTFPIVSHQTAILPRTVSAQENLIHTIASPEAYPGFGVLVVDAFHQVSSVKVSRCFSCYDVIFHCLQKSMPSRIFN